MIHFIITARQSFLYEDCEALVKTYDVSSCRVLLCVNKLAMSVPHYFSHLNNHLDGECNIHGKDEKFIQKYSRKRERQPDNLEFMANNGIMILK